MANVVWRCENDEGDVKYAAIEDHKDILEAKGYVCHLHPDDKWTQHTVDTAK